MWEAGFFRMSGIFVYEGENCIFIFIIFCISMKSLSRQETNVLDTPENSQTFMAVNVFVDI